MAVILQIEFDGVATYRVVHEDHVEMVCPPSRPIVGSARDAGAWYELRDKAGRRLYRMPLPHAALPGEEVPPPRGEASPRRVAGAPRPRVFEIALPDDARGSEVLLVASSSPGRESLGVRFVGEAGTLVQRALLRWRLGAFPARPA